MIPKILCVDDSVTIRKVLTRMLRPFCCKIFEAENGAVGQETTLRVRPDLIILDYNMPVLDGLGLLTRLRDNPAVRRTPVIMLTAESNSRVIAAAARLGVRDYIIKPFREDQLLAKILRVLPLAAAERTADAAAAQTKS